jgi:hypothetical protein
MTIVDTIADVHYGDKVALAMAFAALLTRLRPFDPAFCDFRRASD